MSFYQPKIPANLAFPEVRFYHALYFGALLGILIHAIVALYFFYYHIEAIAVLNLIGLGIYCYLFFLVQNYKLKKAYWIALVEIIIIIFIEVYYVGWDTGFHYYILIFLPVFFLYSHWKRHEIIIASLLVFIGFLGCFLIARYNSASFRLPSEVVYFTNIANFAGAFIAFLGSIFYFNQSIVQIEKKLINTNKELHQGNADKDVLLKEIHHRVKNNLHVVNSILEVQAMEVKDNELKSYLQDAQRRIISMATIHEKMYGSENLKFISASEYLNSLIEDLQSIYDKEKRIRLTFEFDDIELNMDTIAPLAFLVNEVISNSYKHAFESYENASIFGSMKLIGDQVSLKIGDNGTGFEESEDNVMSNNLGVDLIESFVSELNAQYTRTTSNGVVYHFIFDKELKMPEIKEK